ncbi:YbaK/EbsC family protein, partial [Hydrogenophaga sp.]|uniref:YbaK/EbsC family protein n=2 Tax=Hydrogenophaga sp. TaxID=1904254 RepID=UPI0025BAE604
YHDLIDYLSFLGARFDIDMPARQPWRTGARSRGGEAERMPVIAAASLWVKPLPGDICVLVVVPAGRSPTDRGLQVGFGQFRRAGRDEVLALSAGVAPEALPPFGWPYLPGVAKVVVDREIVEAQLVVFNAATLDHKMFMTGHEFKAALGAFELLGASPPLA